LNGTPYGLRIEKKNGATPSTDIVVTFYFPNSSGADEYTLSAVSSDENNGAVTQKETANPNEHILTATPAYGYGLDHWVYKGDSTQDDENAVDGWVIAEDSNGKLTYTVTIDENREYKAVFSPVKLSLGNSRIEVRAGGDGGLSSAVDAKGYLSIGGGGQPLSTEPVEYHADDIVRFWFEYSLSGNLETTRPIHFAIYDGEFTADQLEDQTPIREINARLAAGFGGSGIDENGYRPAVGGQYTAFLRTEELTEDMTHITLAAKLGDAEVIVKTYEITLTELDTSGWVETVVSALNALEPTIVKVPRGNAAVAAFAAAMKKAYPNDYAGGTWFINAHGGAFGLFLNSAGVDPTRQRHRIVDTYNSDAGGATYGINGVFCDLGSSSWKIYGGEVQTWGGLASPNWEGKEEGCAVPTKFTNYSVEKQWAIAVLRDSGVSDDAIAAYIAETGAGYTITVDALKTRFASGDAELAERMTWEIADEIKDIFDPVKAAIDNIDGKTDDARTQAIQAARSDYNTLKNTSTFFGSRVYFNNLFTR
jgi:hypothetical protein